MALIAHIEHAVGATDIAEEKLDKICRILEEALSRPDYTGIYTERGSVAQIYVDRGSCQLELKRLDEAMNTFLTANRHMVTSDAFHGISMVYSDQDFRAFSWDNAVRNLVEAANVNYWLYDDNKARTYFLLGCAYRDPAFATLIGRDDNRSYEYISIAAEMGFKPAIEDLPLYHRDIFGKYKFRG